MTPEQLVMQLRASSEDAGTAFDALVAAGASAIPALTAAIERGHGVPQLTAVLSTLRLDDPVGALAPLLDGADGLDGLDDVHDAGLRALGAQRDPRALPLLVEALPIHRFVAAEALGDLGSPEAVAPLLSLVRKHVGDDGARLPTSNELRSAARCLDLRLVLTVATALAKLGQPLLAGVSIQLATLRDPEEHAEARLVRAAAARSLHHTVAPGVARALHATARDPDADTAREALLGMLYLGRPDEANLWLAIASEGGATAENAAWCLECWSGEPLPRKDDGTLARAQLERWWGVVSPRYADRVAYRLGEPVAIGRLIDELTTDPMILRAELSVRTGARPVQPALTGSPVSAGELAAMRSWWSENASRLPPGKLHRWGRSFEPSAVD